MGKKFAAAEKSNCGTTAEVTEGLYYVLGTTEFKDDNVNITNPHGDPVQISGHLYEDLDNIRHIHIKVTPTGNPTLTTQLILAKPGDQISFDDDKVSKGLPICYLLKFDETTKPQNHNQPILMSGCNHPQRRQCRYQNECNTRPTPDADRHSRI